MPQAWSNKDERMYKHVKAGEEKRGVGEDRAEEIAARTVNKHRKEEGRTKQQQEGRGSKSSSSSGRSTKSASGSKASGAKSGSSVGSSKSRGKSTSGSARKSSGPKK